MGSTGYLGSLISCLVLCAVNGGALALPITTLYSTGVNDAGLPLSGGAVDPHWRLVSSPDPAFPGPNARVLNNSAPPLTSGDYVANTATSKWIAPRPNGGHNFPASDCTIGCEDADYIYETTFDLTGLDPASVVISGRWAVDDSAEMLLNGLSTANTLAFGPGVRNYHVWTPFTLTEGFNGGLNTLTIIVNNQYFPDCGDSANPTGLHVQVAGTADVPEPASLLLLISSAAFFPASRR
jgi:hypothetical protein